MGEKRAGDTSCVQNLECAFSYVKKHTLNIIKGIEQLLFLSKVAFSTDWGLGSLACVCMCACACVW